MFSQSAQREKWKKQGDINQKLPHGVKANGESFVAYSKGKNTLTILRRPHVKYRYSESAFEYQIIYTFLTPDQASALRDKDTGVNFFHSDNRIEIDGIESLYWTNREKLLATLDLIDVINPLNEIKEEVYATINTAPPEAKVTKTI